MHQTIRSLLREGVLVSPDVQNKDIKEIKERVNLLEGKKPFIYGKDIHKLLGEIPGKKVNTQSATVSIIESYIEHNSKITIKDFVTLFNTRYTFLQSLLRQRQDMLGATTIRKIYSTQDRDKVTGR